MKKLISILICIIMTLSFIPFSSSADDLSSIYELTFVASSNVATKVTVRAVNRSGEPFAVRCTKTTFDINFDGDLELSTIFPTVTADNDRLADVRYGSPDGPSIDYIAQRYRRGVQTLFFLSGIDYVSGRFTDQYDGDYVNGVDVVTSMSLFTHGTPVYLIYDNEERTYPVAHPREGRADVTILCDLSQGMDEEVSPGVTRRDVVLDKVSDFAEDLLALNGDSGNRVRIRLVGFGNAIDSNFVRFTKFSGEGGFASYLEDVRDSDFGVGRNWEGALCNAWTYYWMGYADIADRYVILISEGSPTCRSTKGNYSYFGAMENYGVPTTDPETDELYYSLGYTMAGEYQYTLGTCRNYFPALDYAKRLTRYPRYEGGGVDLRTICVFNDTANMLKSLKYCSGNDTFFHGAFDDGVPSGVDGYTFAADGDELEAALSGIYGDIAPYVPAPEPPSPTVIPGDSDGDGLVTMKDVAALKKILAASGQMLPGADVDGDEAVTVKDLTELKKMLAGS